MIHISQEMIALEHEGYCELSPLQKHVYAFGRFDENQNIIYSSATIADRLNEHHEPYSILVGLF